MLGTSIIELFTTAFETCLNKKSVYFQPQITELFDNKFINV
jgi:hypothetical protein